MLFLIATCKLFNGSIFWIGPAETKSISINYSMSSKKLPKIVPVTCLKIFIKDFKRRYLEDGTELHLDFGLVCLQPNGAVLVFFCITSSIKRKRYILSKN